MQYRKLRIAWSVWWGICCVSLIVLWGRSYWRLEILEEQIGMKAVQASSVKGRIATALIDPRIALKRHYLNVVAGDAADWRKGASLGFAHYDGGSIRAIVAPHWLPALISIGLAAIPWFSRSCQFSLRTLLVVTTAVALLLGLVMGLR